ncbi:MAG: alanine racemase [Phycisphaeraceae bacterium]
MANPTLHISAPPARTPSRLEINLSQLEANFAALSRAVQPADQGSTSLNGGAVRVCAVVKKNAYGLGAGPIASRLVKAGCDMLAVYSVDEAEPLVARGLTCPLLLLMPLRHLRRTDPLYRHAVAGRLHVTVHDPAQVDEVNQVGRSFGTRLPVHLHLDTGMSRSGLNAEQFAAALADVLDASHLRLAGLYTHLATADDDADFAADQLRQFTDATAALAPAVRSQLACHVANTCGTLRGEAFHMDMVRPGLGLLGYGVESLAGAPRLSAMPVLRGVVRWVSRIVHVQSYAAGAPVGYGSTHRLDRDSVLGVVPAGYGDGYPLALSNRAVVRVRPAGDAAGTWHEARVLGRVNMDQLVVDLTDAAAPLSLVDAEVEIVSDEPEAPNALPKLAALAESHCYELLCRLAPTLSRTYRQ